jgi:hypothetical protein
MYLIKTCFSKKVLLVLAITFMLYNSSVQAQTITYGFANAQITNDGMDSYYEADITLTTDTDFKLGAGQFYLDYNTAAFGPSIEGGNLIFEHPAASETGYVLDERIFGGALNGYNIVNANSTNSKLSISWSTSIAGQVSTNITVGAPVLICHIKIKYDNINEDPNISFDTTTSPDAVTSFGLTFTDEGSQLTNDSYDSSGAIVDSLSNEEEENLVLVKIYKNKNNDLKIIGVQGENVSVEMFSISGKRLLKRSFEATGNNSIHLPIVATGVYVFKINSQGKIITKKMLLNF